MVRILIVDDVLSVRDTMKDFLEFFVEEIDVQMARNGSEAIEKVKENVFNILISDQNMPDMKGSEFIEATIDKLRADKTEIYIYSGELKEELSIDFKDYGEVQVIDKFESPMFFKDILERYDSKK